MLVEGMLGLGDNLHQRAVIRQMMKRGEVWLQTPWPTVYHDLIGPRLHVVKRESQLRTQQKNIGREAGKFCTDRCPSGTPQKIWYTHDQIKRLGGFLAAMCHNSGLPKCDFSLPVPDAKRCTVWLNQFARLDMRWAQVINCSRETSLTCFPRMKLEDALCS